MLDMLLLVDNNDQVISYAEKIATHIDGKLHRAFSIFAFCRESNTFLLQQRALCKYHSGGVWSNTCCSHPRLGEEILDALNHRMSTELGLKISAQGIAPPNSNVSDMYYFCGKFKYFAQFEKLIEHEIDSVYVYYMTPAQMDSLHPSPEEIRSLRWVSPEELFMWLSEHPKDFSAWFQPALELAYPLIIADAKQRGVILPIWQMKRE